MDMVDIQNATLAGGVAVGAVADLMMQPYGAMLAGTVVGIISTLGFKKLQFYLQTRLGLHDTCGVHNLHGIPGVLSGAISVVLCGLADVDAYGPGLYLILSRLTPGEDSDEFKEAVKALPSIEAGGGRSAGMQAACQALALALTLAVAIVGGICTGTKNGYLCIAIQMCTEYLRSFDQREERLLAAERRSVLRRRPRLGIAG